MRWRAGLLSLVGWLSLIAAPALAQPPVWIVRQGPTTLVLFGSVHLLPPGLDWRPPELTSALAKADEVWFEMPLDDAAAAEAVRLAASRGNLPPSDSLFNHLDHLQGARLRANSQKLGILPASLARMRPWLAEVTLSLAVDLRAGGRADQGVEQQIQAVIPPAARRRAFETPSQQIGYLAGAAMADQIASLNQTLVEIDDRPNAYGQLIGEWMAGDLAGLRADALTPLIKASPALYRRVITDRNQRWAKALRRRLAGGGVIVVVVGMGHLIGPGGVPALLRGKGIEVEGP